MNAIGERQGMQINSMAKQEASLVGRLQARDPLALGDLYDQFGTYVFRIALRLVKDASTAESLTQETFLYIWNRIGAFDAARGTLAGWVGLVARSRAIDYCGSKMRMSCLSKVEMSS